MGTNTKRGKNEAELMLGGYRVNKALPAGAVACCPVCCTPFHKNDAKTVFCSNTGAGNCKNHYWTIMRSSAGKVLLAKLDTVVQVNATNPAAIALFMEEPDVEAFMLKLWRVLGKDDGIDVHCRVNADEIRLVVVLSDQFGLYTHECPVLFETDNLGLVHELVEAVFTNLQVCLNEK